MLPAAAPEDSHPDARAARPAAASAGLDKAKASMRSGAGGSGGSGKLRAAAAAGGSGGKGASGSCPFAALHAAMGSDAEAAGCPVAGAKGAAPAPEVGSVTGAKRLGMSAAGTFKDGMSVSPLHPSMSMVLLPESGP